MAHGEFKTKQSSLRAAAMLSMLKRRPAEPSSHPQCKASQRLLMRNAVHALMASEQGRAAFLRTLAQSSSFEVSVTETRFFEQPFRTLFDRIVGVGAGSSSLFEHTGSVSTSFLHALSASEKSRTWLEHPF